MPPVKLSEILTGMESQGDEMRSLLDKQTGEVFCLMDDELGIGEEDVDPADCPEWRRKDIERAKAVQAEEGSGRFLPLPDRFDINEWEMMRDFAISVTDEDISDRLGNAIHGRGAFRSFKDCVHREGLAEKWHKFRDEQYRQVALEWCESHGVEVDTGAE